MSPCSRLQEKNSRSIPCILAHGIKRQSWLSFGETYGIYMLHIEDRGIQKSCASCPLWLTITYINIKERLPTVYSLVLNNCVAQINVQVEKKTQI